MSICTDCYKRGVRFSNLCEGHEQVPRQLAERLALALEGVVRVADRDTVEFDAARTALAEYRALVPKREGT